MRTTTATAYSERIGIAIDLVMRSLDDPMPPARIADEAGFSRYHFGRIFSAAMGETPAGFVRRLRLERAAFELTNGGDSVTEIGFRAGYETLEAFTKAFRSEYQLQPSGYRRGPSRMEIQCPSKVHWMPNGRHAEPILFLIDGADTARLSDYDRVFDLFDGNDEAAVSAARLRWKSAKSAGHALAYWQQTGRGWEKKA
jgi:DNA polymerase-3 subunit chi